MSCTERMPHRIKHLLLSHMSPRHPPLFAQASGQERNVGVTPVSLWADLRSVGSAKFCLRRLLAATSVRGLDVLHNSFSALYAVCAGCDAMWRSRELWHQCWEARCLAKRCPCKARHAYVSLSFHDAVHSAKQTNARKINKLYLHSIRSMPPMTSRNVLQKQKDEQHVFSACVLACSFHALLYNRSAKAYQFKAAGRSQRESLAGMRGAAQHFC